MKKKATCFLLILAGLFITWGEGMQLIFPRSSLIYPSAIGLLLILYYKDFLKGSQSPFNNVIKPYKYFLIFVAVHTILFLLLNPSYFSFGKEVIIEDGDYLFQKAASGEQIIRYFEFALSSFLLVYLFKTPKYFKYFFIAYCGGFILTILLGGYSSEYSYFTRLSGGMKDPNIMALDALVVLCLSFYLWESSHNNIIKLFFVVCIIISIYAVLFSFSRGAMLAMVVGFSYFFLRKISITYVILSLSILVLMLFFVYKFVPYEIKQVIELRFSLDEALSTGGAGRTDIWGLYLKYWQDYFITGTGLTNCQSVLFDNHLDEYRVTHNQYLEIFVELGVFGFILYLMVIIKCLRIGHSVNGKNFFVVLPFIMMLIVTMFLNIDRGRTFWVIMALINYVYSVKLSSHIKKE